METTNTPKTYCVGHMLIDLPESMDIESPEVVTSISSSLTLGNLLITTKAHVSKEEFESIVATRWKEVQTYTHDPNNISYDKPSSLKNIRENGIMLAFNHQSVETNVRQEGASLVSDFIILYDANGYYWENGTMFTIKSRGGYRRLGEDITNSILNMRYLSAGEVPTNAGTCLNGGFIEHYYRVKPETFVWTAQLPKGLELNIFSSTSVRDKSLLQQYGGIATSNADDPDMVVGGKQYRAARRSNDRLPAEEIVAGVATGYEDPGEPAEFETKFDAVWEYIGANQPEAKPYVRAEMGITPIETSYRPKALGAYPEPMYGQTQPTEKEFFALWDAIVSTIRFRPNALTPAPKAPPKEVIPGPSAQKIAADRKALDDFLDEP